MRKVRFQTLITQQSSYGRATSSHVHGRIALTHYNTIIVRARGAATTILIRGDLDVGNILSFVGQCPQLPDDFVDVLNDMLLHEKSRGRTLHIKAGRITHVNLHSVIAKKGLIESIIVLIKVIDNNLSGLIINHSVTMTIFNVSILPISGDVR